MKNLICLFILSFSALFVTAQNTWEAPLLAQIQKTNTPDLEVLQQATDVIERIALSEKSAWIPAYHAAYYNSQVFWRSGKDGCDECLEQMDAFLKIAEEVDNNSEVLALRANYYQAKLQGSPMMAPFYGPKAGKLLQLAISEDPNNPRAQLLMGQNIFYTPAMFGGGQEKAMPYLNKAAKMLANQEMDPTSVLPFWGKYESDRINKQIASTK